MDEEESCIRCGIEITDDGIIYIRTKVKEKWGNHPICTQCWNRENPGRPAYRVQWSEDPDE